MLEEKELNLRFKVEDILKLNEIISWMNVYKPDMLRSYQGSGVARKIVSSLIDAELNRLLAENIHYKKIEKDMKKAKKESGKRRIKIKELKERISELESSQVISK